ncbi:ABC transporter permease, partial [Yeosuana sp.]|uniref:ABC transporter permease n=1 Tax=Yeosuana sp. TaxID=2529388 RepID=UPI004054ADB2
QNTDMGKQVYSDSWSSTNSATQVFVKIQTNVILENIQKQLDEVEAEHTDQEMLDIGEKQNFHLQPLADLHFNGNYGIFNNSTHQGNKQVLVSLSLVALFLLILGCINFINLNTAQAAKRAKEIGIRKTLGSSKKQLVFQFLGETFILTLCATIISIFLTSWLLQIFSEFIPKSIQFDLLRNPLLLVSIVLILLMVTLLSGFYPALFLSNYKPISVLKNQIISGADKSRLRKYLTVFQFVIAQVLIIATLIVGKQLNFMMTKDMGFKTQANAYIRSWQTDDLSKRLNFTKELSKMPEVSMISLADNPPASNNTSSTVATFITDDKEINTNLELLVGDVNYLKVYNIELLAGRNRLNDTIKEYVINETYSKVLGFKQPAEAIGHYVKVNDNKILIVGVMKNFNQHSLRSDIKPMALGGDIYRNTYPSQFTTIHFSLQKQALKHLTDVISKIQSAWKDVYPEDDFEIHFMDDTIKDFYSQEQKTAVLLKWATSLAIVISCLGLLGFVIHTTERRVKEIGIRKVLGATPMQINLLLCKEFLGLIAIAFLISVPIAWWSMDNWLQDFVYKTNLSWWLFFLSGIVMMLLALIIISIRTIAAANVNPVKNLRSE